MNASLTQPQTDPLAIAQALQALGFARVPAAQFKQWLATTDWQAWQMFADSWNDLGLDTYMADGGRYRRRRFAAYAVSAYDIQRKPRQPHYQSRDYNLLNGGIERWFEPFAGHIATHPLLRHILSGCQQLFAGLTSQEIRPAQWHVECHQFRIEAAAHAVGKPTPEGLHRDGVDWVLVLLVARVNVAEGVTHIHDEHRQPVGEFILAEPLDAAFVDDARVYHAVTPVRPVDPALPAYRDVLVVTFRRA
jgi:hypothetical protein